jgi:hypothetical protein
MPMIRGSLAYLFRQAVRRYLLWAYFITGHHEKMWITPMIQARFEPMTSRLKAYGHRNCNYPWLVVS